MKFMDLFKRNSVINKELDINRQFNINTIYSNETGRYSYNPQEPGRFGERRRGIQVYSPSQIIHMTGRGKDGVLLSWGTEQPYFYLTAEQRNAIFRLSSIIFGIVSSRMNKISSAEFNVAPARNNEDRIAEEMKEKRQIYLELSTDLTYANIVQKAQVVGELRAEMPMLKDDMSNFDSCLLRWKRGLQRKQEHSSDEIKEWLSEPNQGVTWENYIKKVVFNLHIHGAEATYKQFQDGVLENFDSLPGGSVFRLKKPYFSNVVGFIQVISGYEPQIFFENEICFMEYLSTSIQSQPMIPLEALINMISEHLLFDGRMAEVADGTLPPEKMVIITDNGPFGALGNGDAEFKAPLDMSEQKRIETKVNEPKKNAIVTFSGNSAEVIDLSRENNWEFHSGREKDIKEFCGLVFNMTPMELNMAGSEDTSGRATAEVQQDIEQGKGTGPICKIIQNSINRNILPIRFGQGWRLEFVKSKNEREERELDQIKLQNGEYTINDIREKYSLPTFEGDQYNKPKDSPAPDAGNSAVNPMFTKQLQ